jgi:signal transduction histidine kinase
LNIVILHLLGLVIINILAPLIRRHACSGLGLVICSGIIDAHAGKIWLDKFYRDGAAIKFMLPLKEKQAEMEAIRA